MLERVRRVHDVLLERRLVRSELLHDLAEPLPRRARRGDAAEPEVAQRVGDELPLDGLRRARRSLAACEVRDTASRFAELGAELGDQRQAAVERIAQRAGSTARSSGADRTPDAIDLGVDALEALEPIEIGLGDALGG